VCVCVCVCVCVTMGAFLTEYVLRSVLISDFLSGLLRWMGFTFQTFGFENVFA